MSAADDLTEKVRQGCMTPAHAKTIRARRRAGGDRKAALAVTDDLTELLDEVRITLDDVVSIRKLRKAQAIRDAAAAEARAKEEAEHQRWLARQEEERQMAMPWAQFVLAHAPGLGGSVLKGTMTLREAVQTIEKDSGCQVGCQVHFPLTRTSGNT